MDSTCLLMSKSYSSPDDGQYVSSQVKIIELPRWWTVRAFSGQNHRAPQMMDSTCPSYGGYIILTWEDTYSPSSGEMYDFVLRRHVLYIICGALWFWPEKTRTVHHLGSSMILTWEGTYCPSFGDLYHVDLRRHVLSIIWSRSKSQSSPNDGQYVSSHDKIIELSRWWRVRAFSGQNDRAPQMMDSTCLLRSKW
jgi:hypothetical protein